MDPLHGFAQLAFAQLNDVTLRYALDGPEGAPVLVLSPSLGTGLDLWRDAPPYLSKNLRLLRYDPRGHGGSTAPEGDYSLAQLGQDVTALMDYLNIEKAHYCGVSLGGMTGLWLALHAAHRLHSLIAVDTAATIGTQESWNARIAQVRRDGMTSIAQGTLERWYTAGFRRAHPEQVERTQQMLLSTPVAGYAGCCAAIRDEDLTAAVGSIDLPTLVMTGKDDLVTPVTDGEFLQREIAGSRFVKLAGAHLACVEDAVGLDRAVEEFLRSTGRLW